MFVNYMMPSKRKSQEVKRWRGTCRFHCFNQSVQSQLMDQDYITTKDPHLLRMNFPHMKSCFYRHDWDQNSNHIRPINRKSRWSVSFTTEKRNQSLSNNKKRWTLGTSIQHLVIHYDLGVYFSVKYYSWQHQIKQQIDHLVVKLKPEVLIT